MKQAVRRKNTDGLVTLVRILIPVFFVSIIVCFAVVAGSRYSYTFVVDGEAVHLDSYERDTLSAMTEAGIELGYGDTYTQLINGRIVNVEISRSVRVLLTVDGRTSIVSTAGKCVRDLLAQSGIILGPEDELSCSEGDFLYDGMEVSLTTVRYLYEDYEIPYACQVVKIENPAEAAGVTNVIIPGKQGVKCQVYRSTYVGGELVERVQCAEYMITEPVDRVIELGTGLAPDVEDEPAGDEGQSAKTSADGTDGQWSPQGDEGDTGE